MKKNAPYIIVLLSLAITFCWIYFGRDNSNFSEEMDFSVSNSKEVYTIEISNKYSQKVVLTKNKTTWKVNNKMPADERKIKAMLDVLEKLTVESMVTNQNRKKIIEGLRQNSIKILLKDEDGNEIKTIHVGEANTAMTGSYMILEREGKVAPNPYIVNMPGYNGSLKYYFPSDSFELWSPVVFQTPIDYIEYIEVNYSDNPKASFKINKDEGMVKILPFVDLAEIKKTPNKSKITNFLLDFEFANLEGWIKDEAVKRQIAKLPVYCSILVRDIEGNERKATFYRKPSEPNRPVYGKNGQKLPFDIQRLYCVIFPDKKQAIVQYYTFGPILRDYAYFFE